MVNGNMSSINTFIEKQQEMSIKIKVKKTDAIKNYILWFKL